MTRWFTATASALALLLMAAPASAQDETAAQSPGATIAEAASAAPQHLRANATVMTWDGTVLREGTNGWTCMPTPPGMVGTAPMCLDAPWLAWAQAWSQKTEVDIARAGVGYMLAGDTGASNSDPFATGPDAVDDWVDAGSHVMVIVPDPAALEGFPTDPHAGAWVMWQGTPYAHIMIPIEEVVAP